MQRSLARPPRRTVRLATAGAMLGVSLLAAGCTSSAASSSPGVISVIGAESTYASVVAQIGGKYVQASSILGNPNTDPHTFEASTSVAQQVSGARLIVQNGLGYDTFMNRIEAASANPARKVIIVQALLHLPDSTPNPHLWYRPATMPAVARAVAAALARLQPAHAAYFQANVKKFVSSLEPWLQAISAFKALYLHATVATTEPVADYLLQAMGTDDLTPFRFQAAVMNGVDPAPQDISLVRNLITQHKVRVFVYNEQVTDPLTVSLKQAAAAAHVPVVGVYETLPTGHSYQSWMLAEARAIQRAVAGKISTEKL